MPFLQYQDGLKYRYFELPNGKMLIFGRENHCDFQLIMDPLISREHFGVGTDENNNMTIIDLGATNGTFINDKRMESNEIIILNDEDRIRAGSQHFVYYLQIPSHKTQDLMNEVAGSVDSGKGFSTMMSEIIGKGNLS